MNVEAIRKRIQTFAGARTKVRATRPMKRSPLLNGFVIAVGKEWALFHPFHDFYPEGYTVFRVRDVVELRSGEFERHWERMLEAESLLSGLEGPFDLPLDDVRALLEGIRRLGENVIVECEGAKMSQDDDFYIGRILQVDLETASFAHFDALGRWESKPQEIRLAEITLVQLRTPYVQTMSKYLSGPCRLAGEGSEGP